MPLALLLLLHVLQLVWLGNTSAAWMVPAT